MKKKLVMNVKLLRKIQKLFREKPSKSLMSTYGRLKNKYENAFDGGDEVPLCKTHLCIGGAALVLSGKAKMRADIEGGFVFVDAKTGDAIQELRIAAANVLGIDPDDATRLFHEDEWPNQFRCWAGRGSRVLAKNMVARIEHLIRTGE